MTFKQITLAIAFLGMQAPLCAMQQQPPSDKELEAVGRKTVQVWNEENRNRPQTANSDDFILWTPQNGLLELYQLIGNRVYSGELIQTEQQEAWRALMRKESEGQMAAFSAESDRMDRERTFRTQKQLLDSQFDEYTKQVRQLKQQAHEQKLALFGEDLMNPLLAASANIAHERDRAQQALSTVQAQSAQQAGRSQQQIKTKEAENKHLHGELGRAQKTLSKEQEQNEQRARAAQHQAHNKDQTIKQLSTEKARLAADGARLRHEFCDEPAAREKVADQEQAAWSALVRKANDNLMRAISTKCVNEETKTRHALQQEIHKARTLLMNSGRLIENEMKQRAALERTEEQERAALEQAHTSERDRVGEGDALFQESQALFNSIQDNNLTAVRQAVEPNLAVLNYGFQGLNPLQFATVRACTNPSITTDIADYLVKRWVDLTLSDPDPEQRSGIVDSIWIEVDRASKNGRKDIGIVMMRALEQLDMQESRNAIQRLGDDGHHEALEFVEDAAQDFLREDGQMDLTACAVVVGYLEEIAKKFPQELNRSIERLSATQLISGEGISPKSYEPLRINPNRKGFTFLHYVTMLGLPELLETYLANGADPKAVSTRGWTMLHALTLAPHPLHAQADRPAVAKRLVELGVDPLSETEQCPSVPRMAIQKEAYDVLHALLLAKPDILDDQKVTDEIAQDLFNAVTNGRNQAMHIHVPEQHADDINPIWTMLTQHGATFDKAGMTQLAAATSPQTGKPKKKIGPNEKCPCNSGKKYKKCCGSPSSSNVPKK